jgi:hypothetical protein
LLTSTVLTLAWLAREKRAFFLFDIGSQYFNFQEKLFIVETINIPFSMASRKLRFMGLEPEILKVFDAHKFVTCKVFL